MTMRQASVLTIFLLSFLSLCGQETPPAWLDPDLRKLRFPGESFYTGFSEYMMETGKTVQECCERASLQAQTILVSEIRLQLTSSTQSRISVESTTHGYAERESFFNQTSTTGSAEIAGMKTEIFYDKQKSRVYAFAYVNKEVLIDYYKSHLMFLLSQAESFVNTAHSLELSGEKAKARSQLELAQPIFVKVFREQELLTAIDGNTSAEDLQHSKADTLYHTLVQMQARLAQGVYVLVNSSEDFFGTKTNIVANKVKAELAKNGCSFVETTEEADFQLTITVTTRLSSSSGGFVFCYADTQVELYDVHKQKVVYSDEIAQKGGSNSQEKAGRKALGDVAGKVAEKLQPWIQ